MEFSENIKTFMQKEFPDVNIDDIKDMDLHSLKQLREKILEKRQEYALIELAYKTCANAAYGSSGNEHFYWYRPELASAITGEARLMTFLQWRNFPKFMREDVWERKDLWEKFDFKLDELGKLPDDLKRGVLSEDGIADILDRFDYALFQSVLSKSDPG